MEWIVSLICLILMIIGIILNIKKVLNFKQFCLLTLVLALILISMAVYLYVKQSSVIFKLKGDKNIELKLNEEYKELGVIAKVKNKDYSAYVIITGEVDNTKIGKQKLTYKLTYNGKEYKIERIINVVDDEKPVISFDEDIKNICPNYNEVDYHIKAMDNYDGDITDKIKIEEEKIDKKLEVTFTVTDSSGNTKTVIKTYELKDNQKPVINLNGSDIYVVVGNKYNEPGYSATDSCSGDITNKVNVKGNLDTSKEGTYTLTYEVSDDANNKSTISRNVYVINASSTSNKIYLTFDDGPSNITPDILNILKEEGVSATFFVIGFDSDKDYIVKRIVDEGHTIAIHGMSHVYQDIYCSEEAYMNNINSLQDRIYNVTGEKTWITRFPGGSSNKISSFNPGIMTRLTKLVSESGYHYFDWNIDSNDAGGANMSSTVYNNVVTHLRHDRLNVVLMHDAGSKKQTLGALRDIIKYGKDNGYIFDRITMETPLVIHSVSN